MAIRTIEARIVVPSKCEPTPVEVAHIELLLLIVLIWTVVVTTFLVAARRDGRIPVDDVGVLWLLVMAIYTTLSPLSWLFRGGVYAYSDDPRLYVLQPSNEDVAALLSIGLAYTFAFALVYLVLRRVPRWDPVRQVRIDGGKMVAAIGIVVVFKITMLILTVAGYIRPAESYIDSYLSIQELPLSIRQAIKIASGISDTAQLVVLVAILQRWPRLRLLFPLYIVMLLLSFDPDGARFALATGLLATAVAWHLLVRPIPGRWWVTGALLGLLIFLALGARRDLGSWSDVEFRSSSLGEFDSIWANGVELLKARAHGWTDVPDTTRFGEIWAFIPSQIMSGEKVSMSAWFLHAFHPEYGEQGGGLVFGAVAQAVVGGGVFEALIRGAVLGALAAWVLKWHRTRSRAWWHLPLYLYLFVTLYNSVRDTTFRAHTDVIQLVMPALVIIAVIGRIISRAARSPERQ